MAAYDTKLQHILQSAARIFAAHGYEKASLRDISRETEMSLAGLYHYFRSKEELLFLIADTTFATIWQRLEVALAPVKGKPLPPETQIRRLIHNHLDFYISHRAEMKVLSVDSDALTGEWSKRFHERKRLYTTRCVEILQALARERGLPLDAAACRLSALALFGMMNWLYQWYDPRRDGDANLLTERMAGIFLSGFLAEGKGVNAPNSEPVRSARHGLFGTPRAE